ncbi:MAG: hypothetical protein Q4E12_08030 [Coriobacteriia bacterium]|nr:hypothetical protein [Coriobacteriia bacterium]
MKNRVAALVFSALCLVIAVAFVGCANNGVSSPQAQAQAENRAYMSQVNQTMETLNEKLDLFVDAVSRGDAIGMKTQVDRAMESLTALENLEAPEALKEVQDSYKSGCENLKLALKDYVNLVTTTEDFTAIDAAALETIQSEYDAGVKALKEADEKAASL